jgi:hypothetical protein
LAATGGTIVAAMMGADIVALTRCRCDTKTGITFFGSDANIAPLVVGKTALVIHRAALDDGFANFR